MNYKMMGRFLAHVLMLEGLFMLPALFISVGNHETVAITAFLCSIAISIILALVLYGVSKGAKSAFYATEGMVCVSFSWIIMSVVGCLPFVISGSIPHFMDALFETVSGFTTTGASILADVEILPKGILYWRSFSHWVGGMGVLVFLLAIIPGGERGTGFTMHLLRAESPGPSVGKLVPKMRKTAAILYYIYIALTVADTIFLLLGGMPLFEAVCHAFGTAGTGGFGVKGDSFASYSPYLQNVTTVFMLLFGVNFSCYYLLLIGSFRSVFKDEELRAYVCMVLGAIAMIAWNIRGFYATLGETIRHSAFQVASVVTTTGYATADFDLWPSFSKAILLTLMVVGACAGSTGGGMKVARAMLLMKSMRRNILQVLHPRKVLLVRNNDSVVDEKTIASTNAYLAAYVIIIFVSFMIVSLDGYSVATNFSAILCTFNNIGPGVESVGPTCNFGGFSDLSKLVFIFDMLLGRLEIFPILVLFSRHTWKNV